MRQLIPLALSTMFVAVTWAPCFTFAADAVIPPDAIKKYKVTTTNFQSWPELKPSRGIAFRDDSAVYLAFDKVPSGAKFVFPRLNNPTKRVYLLGKPETELSLRPDVKEWIITLPKELPQGAEPLIVVQTIGRPHLPTTPQRIKPTDQGLLVLPAHKALTHGEKLRYEPQPHKNTVGYWTHPKDFAQWFIEVPQPGEYDLHVLQGCGKGQGGSHVSIQVRSSGSDVRSTAAIAFTVKETGHFQNFVRRKVGSVSIRQAGLHTVEIRPDRLANKAVMDVREVRLVPK